MLTELTDNEGFRSINQSSKVVQFIASSLSVQQSRLQSSKLVECGGRVVSYTPKYFSLLIQQGNNFNIILRISSYVFYRILVIAIHLTTYIGYFPTLTCSKSTFSRGYSVIGFDFHLAQVPSFHIQFPYGITYLSQVIALPNSRKVKGQLYILQLSEYY